MKEQTLLFLGITLFLVFSSISCQNEDSGQRKYEILKQRSEQQKNGIIYFTLKEFQDYVLTFPRPYDVVIFFSANSCQFCDEMQNEFFDVSLFYAHSGALEQSKDKNQRPVFFSIVKFNEEWRETYVDLDFKSVPNILVSLPQTALLNKDERLVYLKGFKWLITYTDGHVTSHKMLEYINKRTGRNVQYQMSVLSALTIVGGVLGVLFLGGLIFIKFKTFFVNSKVWYSISIVLYCVCCSGVVYNIIHNIPMTIVNNKGETEWFSNQQRMQLGAEGFVMSFAMTLAGIIMVAIQNKKFLSKLDSGSAVRIVYLLLFATLWLVVSFIEEIYSKKGWYNHPFFPPDSYSKGSLIKDKGNSF